MSLTARALTILSTALILSAHLAADNWPQFRGSRSGVAADDPALPDTWSAADNVVWKIDVPGRGWSSPVVWGDHVFVTAAAKTAGADDPLLPVPSYAGRSVGGPMSGRDIAASTDEHRWVLYDIDFKTGKVRWQSAVHAAVPKESKHQKNSYASETPVTDGERVYVYFGNAGLFAYDLNGKPVWSKPMGPFKVRQRLGARLVARRPQGSRLHRQRQRRSVVHRRLRRAHRRRSVEGESRRGQQLDDAGGVGEQGAHGDRHRRHR